MNQFRRLAHRARQVHLHDGEKGLARAVRMLADALAPIDPITAPAHADLIAAADQYAVWATDPDEKLTWARYAEHAGRTLYGTDSPRYLHLAEDYAGILIDQGLAYPAITLYEAALGAWLRRRGENDQVINLHSLLAQALHADGQCAEAEEHSTAALSLRIAVGRGNQSRIEEVLVTAATVLAGCGRFREAVHLLQVHGPRHDWCGYPVDEVAEFLATTEREHLSVCSRHRTGHPPPGPQRREGWLFLLEKITTQTAARRVSNSSNLPAENRRIAGQAARTEDTPW